MFLRGFFSSILFLHVSWEGGENISDDTSKTLKLWLLASLETQIVKNKLKILTLHVDSDFFGIFALFVG